MATILCVEDEADLREDIAEELQDAGYDTLEARDGFEGLQMILRNKPDLVISDVSMPRMDGHRLVEQLRVEHPEHSDMPFIFLTAYTDRQDMIDGIKLGADDYLNKPVDYEMLQIKVASALRQTGRMMERKREQQVKLYKALTTGAEPAPETPAKPDLPRKKIVLIGASQASLWQVQRQLEDFGQDVRVFTSGRAFLDKVQTMAADLVMIWFQSDDMQAPMVAAMSRGLDAKTIMMIPEDFGCSEAEISANGANECLSLPLADEALAAKLTDWFA